jgi:hypothetical protein
MTNQPTSSNSNSSSGGSYKLKVNINGFKLEDIRVSLVNTGSFCSLESERDKVQVKISAQRMIKINQQETTQELSKSYDIFKSKSSIDVASMKHYIDPRNPLYLVVEFASAANEDHFINLDDSCESLVESAAKSLLNIRNIENLKSLIENPQGANVDPALREYFSPSLINDLNMATKTSFTPVKIECDKNNNKQVRIELNIPNSIRSGSILTNDQKTQSDTENHVRIKFNGLKVSVEAVTSSENVTSTFSKQFSLPKGSQTDKANFSLDEHRHLLIINAPYVENRA